ncbi:MAG: hypothetical protein IKN18_02675 [Neisseriaceae bacterium]|nr:hypothetical protein [Neisseriaceae bacterium]
MTASNLAMTYIYFRQPENKNACIVGWASLPTAMLIVDVGWAFMPTR